MEETVDEAFARVRVQEPALAFYAAALVAEHWADDRFMEADEVDLAGADDDAITRMHDEFFIDALISLGERGMAAMYRNSRAEYEHQLAIGEMKWNGLLSERAIH